MGMLFVFSAGASDSLVQNLKRDNLQRRENDWVYTRQNSTINYRLWGFQWGLTTWYIYIYRFRDYNGYRTYHYIFDSDSSGYMSLQHALTEAKIWIKWWSQGNINGLIAKNSRIQPSTLPSSFSGADEPTAYSKSICTYEWTEVSKNKQEIHIHISTMYICICYI